MKRSVIYTSGTQVLIQLAGLFTGILVARLLGPDGRGQLAAVISWGSMLVYFGNLGLPTAYCYSAAREPTERMQLFVNGAFATLVQWLLLVIVGVIVLPFALVGQGTSITRLAFYYLCAYAPLNLLGLYIVAILQGSAEYGRYNLVRMTVPIVYGILLIILWTFGLFNVTSVVVATVLSNAVTLLVGLILVIPVIRGQRSALKPLRFGFKTLKRDFRYGLAAQIGAIQPFSGLRIDVLFLTVLVGARDLGLYIAALAGVELLRAQGYALGQVVFPEVARRKRRDDQFGIVGRFGALALLFGVVGVAVVLIFAKQLLLLVYGTDYVDATPVLKIMIFGGAIAAIYRVLADGSRGMGLPFAATVAELAALGVGIGALAVCVPIWGITGAAVAVVLSSAASFCVIGIFTVSLWRRDHNRVNKKNDQVAAPVPSFTDNSPVKQTSFVERPH